MTRKESGWVSDAMRLIGAYCQECAAQPDPNARQQREALNAINSHITSMQSAAEGLEEALRLLMDGSERRVFDGEPHWRIQMPAQAAMEYAHAALAAFQAIKEKQT